MNPKQTRIQNSLSQGRGLGQNSSERSVRRIQYTEDGGEEDFADEQGQDYVEEISDGNQPKEKSVSFGIFVLVFFVALGLDVIGVVPILGWLFSSVVLIIIYIVLGVKLHLKNILKFTACDVLKFIPFLSIFPAFALSVILNVGPMVGGMREFFEKTIEMATTMATGGDKVAGRVARRATDKVLKDKK